MKESMLDVLLYLFENYYMDEEAEQRPDRQSLQRELLEAGFDAREIEKSFAWLDGLSQYRHTGLPALETAQAIRVYAPREHARLDVDARGFLMFLEQIGILDPATRELVLDRVMALDTGEVDLEQLKWIVLMVLFNQPGQEAAYAWMEDLVFDAPSGHLH
ncbi:MAG: DUF494 domain-containing protein [Gammaproteobacteria bacterium]|nr:MAG: DUF494 domain-containing protein [Gammaproteobacteria bacterium]